LGRYLAAVREQDEATPTIRPDLMVAKVDGELVEEPLEEDGDRGLSRVADMAREAISIGTASGAPLATPAERNKPLFPRVVEVSGCRVETEVTLLRDFPKPKERTRHVGSGRDEPR